jgi:peroxiredoxin
MILGLALAWIAILMGCWLGWQLLRQNGRLLLRVEELENRLDELESGEPDAPSSLPLGSPAPEFSLPDLTSGQTQSLADFRGQSVLLIFFNPACGFCRELVPKLAVVNSLPVLIVSTGEAEANRQLFSEHPFTATALLQKEMEVASAYKGNGTPSGYLISPEGNISSGLAMGADALLGIANESRSSRGNEAHLTDSQPSTINGHGQGSSAVTPASTNGDGADRLNRFTNRSVVRSKIKRDGLKAGTPAPDFRLPRLDGRGELSLSELRGRRVLLVFSSPDCGPCNELAPKLERSYRSDAGGGGRGGEGAKKLEIIMISKGEPKENRAKVKEHGLTFRIVLQQQWEISRRYAMFATPIAYLIDEHGIIVHDVAVGADAILELLVTQKGPEFLKSLPHEQFS